jgi:hypothetical protein
MESVTLTFVQCTAAAAATTTTTTTTTTTKGGAPGHNHQNAEGHQRNDIKCGW